MSKASIIVSYDGESLKNHTMDIRELSISLTGLADIFQEANLVLNKGQATTSIQVKAFKEGSFQIHFDVIQSGINFLGIFDNSTITGALNLAQILGFSGGVTGLFKFIKFLKGKGIKDKSIIDDKLKITNYFGDSLIINNNVYNLYQNTAIRKGFEKAVEPVLTEGIDVLEIFEETKNGSEKIDSINKSDAEYFVFSEQENKINEYESEMYLNLISPSFEDGNKWRFSTGSGKFYATIKDENFLNEINSGIKLFGKKDILKARVLVKQNETGDFQIKNEYEILEVIEHKRNDQLGLF